MRAVVIRRVSLGLVSAGSIVVTLSFVVGGRLAEVAFACIAVLFPLALILLARPRASRLLCFGLLLLAGVLLTATLGILFLDPVPVAGLPGTAWWMLIGVGLVPLLLVIGLYAATFSEEGR